MKVKLWLYAFIELFMPACSTTQIPSKISFEKNNIRYTKVSDDSIHKINWVFIPGGPGADSRYLLSLINILDLPGKVWRIDFPGNGDNPTPKDYDFHQWLKLTPEVVSNFEQTILVGHSLGGMLPLLSPELEDSLLGLIIINSAPKLWFEASSQLSKQFNIPNLSQREAFIKNPTQENYIHLLEANIPYFFNEESRSRAKDMFKDLPFPISTMMPVLKMMNEINYSAAWIPKKVPTLIIGGDQDYLNPFSIYEEDERFKRSNISLVRINNSGHWCWIDRPMEVKKYIEQFYKNNFSGLWTSFKYKIFKKSINL